MKTNTQKLAGSALLAAISVVLARLIIPMPSEVTRFSVEAVPVFLAGLLYGPVYGAMVGFSADAVGCLFSPYGYNPIFCLPPILYGLFGGLLRLLLRERLSVRKIALGFLPPVAIGSVLWQSFALAVTYGSKSTLWESCLGFLATRSIQFAVTYVADVVLVTLVCRSNLFYRLGYLPRWEGRNLYENR